jgi:hypothetical protein
MATPRLVVLSEWILPEVLKISSDWCLDLEDGRLVHKDRAKDDPLGVGEGRPAAQRMRYVKVPCLWEAAVEIATRFPGPKPELRRSNRLFRDLRLTLAATIATQNWLVSLQLPHEILWSEGAGKEERVLVYRPRTGKWTFASERLYRLLRSAPTK